MIVLMGVISDKHFLTWIHTEANDQEIPLRALWAAGVIMAPFAMGLIETKVEEKRVTFRNFVEGRTEHGQYSGQRLAVGFGASHKMIEPRFKAFTTNSQLVQRIDDVRCIISK